MLLDNPKSVDKGLESWNTMPDTKAEVPAYSPDKMLSLAMKEQIRTLVENASSLPVAAEHRFKVKYSETAKNLDNMIELWSVNGG